MNFRQAVAQTPCLETAHKPGLKALRSQDRAHIVAADTRKIVGSVDIDAALRATDPHANRWDFAIGYRHRNRAQEVIYWVELHTASDSEIKVVIRKARWLREWLKQPGNALNRFERDIVWVSSGSTSFTLTSPQRKLMAQQGLIHTGGKLHIPDSRS